MRKHLNPRTDPNGDASRQVRVATRSSDPDIQASVLVEGPDVLEYPQNSVEGNDDPNQSLELPPYLPNGVTAKMTDTDEPYMNLPHALGDENITVEMLAQFRQFGRVQIGDRWYLCSDYFESELILKAKHESGKWINNGSEFILGNDSPFPPQ